jgi:hypothetical protein
MVLTQVRSIVCGTGELGETVAMLIENQNPSPPFAGGIFCTNASKVTGLLVRSRPFHFDPARLTLGASAIR